jgi:hypothetical protein
LLEAEVHGTGPSYRHSTAAPLGGVVESMAQRDRRMRGWSVHRISHRWVAWVAASATLLFTASGGVALWADQPWPSLLLLPLAVICAGLWARAGVTIVDDAGVAYAAPIGRYRLDWADMTVVEVDATLSAVVFRGDGRQLAIIGPALWTRAERDRTWRHLRLRIESLDLPVRHSARAPLLRSHGTKVPRRDLRQTLS